MASNLETRRLRLRNKAILEMNTWKYRRIYFRFLLQPHRVVCSFKNQATDFIMASPLRKYVASWSAAFLLMFSAMPDTPVCSEELSYATVISVSQQFIHSVSGFQMPSGPLIRLLLQLLQVVMIRHQLIIFRFHRRDEGGDG